MLELAVNIVKLGEQVSVWIFLLAHDHILVNYCTMMTVHSLGHTIMQHQQVHVTLVSFATGFGTNLYRSRSFVARETYIIWVMF